MKAQTIEASYIRYVDMEKSKEIVTDPIQQAILNEFSFLSKPNKFTLIYSNNQSEYKEKKDSILDDELQVGESDRLFNKLSNLEEEPYIYYKDFNAGDYKAQKYLLGRLFLVDGKLNSLNWTITELEEEFGDFKCKVATATDSDNRFIEAYYTEEIPVSDGPDMYFGLPGLILQVKIAANVISLKELKIIDDKIKIKVPNQGKEVSEKEYEEILKEKLSNSKSFLSDFN